MKDVRSQRMIREKHLRKVAENSNEYKGKIQLNSFGELIEEPRYAGKIKLNSFGEIIDDSRYAGARPMGEKYGTPKYRAKSAEKYDEKSKKKS